MIITETFVFDEEDLFESEEIKELFNNSSEDAKMIFLHQQLGNGEMEDFINKIYKQIIEKL